jgi:hypothetical protein
MNMRERCLYIPGINDWRVCNIYFNSTGMINDRGGCATFATEKGGATSAISIFLLVGGRGLGFVIGAIIKNAAWHCCQQHKVNGQYVPDELHGAKISDPDL